VAIAGSMMRLINNAGVFLPTRIEKESRCGFL
jgi:hypothetical protein